MPAPDEPASGDVLHGRYEIREELGRGGMATVYRGRDLRLQRPVAIKVFRGGFGDAVDARRTTQEMRLLARVDHPSVVSVLDASTGEGGVGAYLVMELVQGDDLGALLHRARGPLTADFARRIVADTAGALQALHALDVVHRDVKPANILVPSAATSSQALVSAKLTDFGIARLVDGARITGPESILGTAAYLSPEQVRGMPPEPASDVYSLGLVLLEALTGRRAFPGPSAEAAMARLHRPPPLPADASPDLAHLLSRMTAMDPAQRPTAGEVSADLRGQLAGRVLAPDTATTAPTAIPGPRPATAGTALDEEATRAHDAEWTLSRGMPIVTGPQPVAPVAAQPRRRAPAVLAVVASVLAAGIGVAAVSAASSTGAPSAEPRTPAPASSSRPAVRGTREAPALQPAGATGPAPASATVRPSASASASTSRPAPAPSRTSTGDAPVSTGPTTDPGETDDDDGTGTGTGTGTDPGVGTDDDGTDDDGTGDDGSTAPTFVMPAPPSTVSVPPMPAPAPPSGLPAGLPSGAAADLLEG